MRGVSDKKQLIDKYTENTYSRALKCFQIIYRKIVIMKIYGLGFNSHCKTVAQYFKHLLPL